MANSVIIGSQLSELPERLSYYGENIEFLSQKRARLFPSGTSAKKTKETDLTSIFLSTLIAIKPYRQAMLNLLNSKAKKVSNKSAQLHVFTEISNRNPDGSLSDKGRPDGLIVLTTGKAETIEWAAFVEVKANSLLDSEQINRYLDIARKHEVDLITISDQIVSTPFQTPIREKLNSRNVNVYHWSWIYIRTKAQQVIESANQLQCEETFDVDQIYILEEFVRYLEDPKINVGHFEHMGKEWSPSVKELRQLPNGAKLNSNVVDSIATSWMHEEQDLCYHIYLRTTLKVYLDLTKKEKENSDERKERIVNSLLNNKCIGFSLLVPNSISVIDSLESSNRKKVHISVCLLSSSITMSTEIDINKDQKAIGQTSSFIANMERVGAGMEDELRVTAIYKRKKKTEPIALKELQNQKVRKLEYATVDKNLGDQIERMEVSQCVELGRAVFASPTKFISRVETSVTNYISQLFDGSHKA